MTAELIDHNIATFLRRIGEMPSGILLHPKGLEILVNEYKEAFGSCLQERIKVYGTGSWVHYCKES